MPVTVVADNIRSLYNLGSIFRTSDAVLLEKICLCGISGCPPNVEIEKVALGATNTVEFEYFESSEECVRSLKKRGLKIYALEITDQKIQYDQLEYQFPLALIIGNEVEGVSDEVMKYVDQAIFIPMRGRANSLNVSNALAVCLYKISEQFYANH